jgi:hypothetical protein
MDGVDQTIIFTTNFVISLMFASWIAYARSKYRKNIGKKQCKCRTKFSVSQTALTGKSKSSVFQAACRTALVG